MASAVDSRLAYARLSAVATASRLPTATRGSNNSYTTSWDTTRAAPLPGGSRTRWIATRGFSSCHPPLQGFAWRNSRSAKP